MMWKTFHKIHNIFFISFQLCFLKKYLKRVFSKTILSFWLCYLFFSSVVEFCCSEPLEIKK